MHVRRGAVIFLHGSGDTGRGVREWLHLASGGKFEARLAELGLGYGVYPTATQRRYTLAEGQPSTVWFDRESLRPSPRQDREGVHQSLRQVEEELQKLEAAGVPRSGIFVGGFSMGGGLALELLARESVARRLAGVFCHASFLGDDSTVFDAAPSRVPVHMSHGDADEMVAVSWGRSTADRLRARGFDVSFVEHEELGHELGERQAMKVEVAELLEWLSETTKRPEFGETAEDAPGCSNPARSSLHADAKAPLQRGEGKPDERERPSSVGFEISDLGTWQSRATFSVPPGSEELLSGASVCARGAFFQLEPVPNMPGKVATTFMSPKPDLTAEAIALRIEQRLSDPRPPGMEEACCVS